LFRDHLTAEYLPQTFTEAALVEQMAVALFKRTLFEEIESRFETEMREGNLSHNLQIVWRRQAALDRAFHKALAELRKLQQSRLQSQPATSQPETARTSTTTADPTPDPFPAD